MAELKPVAEKALTDTEPEITARVKSFVYRLQKQSDIDTSTLTSNLVNNLHSEGMRSLADAISGKIYSMILVSRRKSKGEEPIVTVWITGMTIYT
jgi:hypothetical protein